MHGVRRAVLGHGAQKWEDMLRHDREHRAAVAVVLAVRNSFFVGALSTLLATTLGTLAALGLSRPLPLRSLIMSIILEPMIVPIIVLAAGAYFVFARAGLVDSYI